MPPSRSRKARSARRSRDASAPRWSRCSRSSPSRSAVRGGRGRDQEGARRPRAPRPRSRASTTRSRTRAPAARAGGGAPKLKLAVAHHRGNRPLRPRPGRARRSPACPTPATWCAPRSPPRSASTASRCRSGGGYVWFEVAGIKPVARAPARRGQRAGRGALARARRSPPA